LPTAHEATVATSGVHTPRVTIDSNLVDACTRFRTALEEQEAMPVAMKDFPFGTCGDSTEMLGQYLDD